MKKKMLNHEWLRFVRSSSMSLKKKHLYEDFDNMHFSLQLIDQ